MKKMPSPFGLSGVVNKIPLPASRKSFDIPMDDQSSVTPIDQSRYVVVDVDLIDVSPYQPRIRFDQAELESLAQSISSSTQSTPITVRPLLNGRFELIGGERRLRASKLLGNKSIECVIRALDDMQAALFAVIDNETRSDLTDYERGRSYKRLIAEGRALNQSELALKIGVSNSTITRCMSYFKLPEEVLAMLNVTPDLVGNRVVADFAKMTESGYQEIVTKHIKSISDGSFSQDAALSNAKAEITEITSTKEKKAPPKPQPLLLGESQIGEFKIQGKRDLSIRCEKGIDPHKLMQAISKFLSEHRDDFSSAKPSKKPLQ
jgi:ParB family transcriptional regulator, chromosome partitioning protein